jgi:hypothetical protein
VATLTVNPAMLALLGLTVRDLQTPVLTQNAISALGRLLVYEGFNLARLSYCTSCREPVLDGEFCNPCPVSAKPARWP